MKITRRKIPEGLYQKIHQVIPIVTVDLVVKNRGSFLLVKRKNEPEANVWYFPGGRVLKNERLKEAAKRKLKEETGLTGKTQRLLGIHEHFYNPRHSYFKNFSSHVISFVFEVSVSQKSLITLDKQSSDFRWFPNIEKNFKPYLKKFLKESGFKNKK